MHAKRQGVSKTWAVARKGTKYVVKPNFNPHRGVPILVVLRDMLKVAQNRKEVKRALCEKKILLNSVPVFEDKNVALLFDVITIVPSEKSYRLFLNEKGRFDLKEISAKDSGKKVAKIVGKKVLKGKKVQLNLSDGRNFISDVKCEMGDSAIVGFKDRKIESCIPLAEGSSALVVAGKHAGKEGKIKGIHNENKTAEIDRGEDVINVLLKQIMAVENGK